MAAEWFDEIDTVLAVGHPQNIGVEFSDNPTRSPP
jgi:hypothetical protein